MTTCFGKRGIQSCGSALFKCKICGREGCDRERCTNQVFKAGKCLHCGAEGQRESAR